MVGIAELLTPDAPATGKRLSQSVRDGRRQLRDSFRRVREYARIVRFLIARMIYTDGLTTLFTFGGVYAAGTFGGFVLLWTTPERKPA